MGVLTVNAMVVQRDGKILLGGEFTQLLGQTGLRNRIARIFPNGSPDPDFNPGADGVVNCFALQPDGKILVGGDFTTFGGQPRDRIARLNEDGSLDESFNPGANGAVTCVAIQNNGKILVGGSFSNCGGAARASIARLNEDGTLDTTFNPGANGDVLCFALQPDGKFLVGGRFTTLSGGARQRLGRLNSNGSLDTGFNPAASGDVTSLVLQSDGKILVGGNFSTIGGATRHRMARLETDGTADTTFDGGFSSTSGIVNSVVIQQEGHILVGGAFTSVAGSPRSRFARFLNPDATSELSVQNSTQIDWTRGGSAPDLEQVAFDSWNGTEWVALGPAQRVPGGWQATGLSLPSDGLIRAHGRLGDGSGSTGMIEQFLEIGTPQFPGLEVRLNEGEPIGKGRGALEYDLAFGEETTATQTITLKNTGSVALTGLVAQIGAAIIPQFSAGALSSTTLAPGQSLTFPVEFVPSREGEFFSNIEIFSNDPYDSRFDVSLVGIYSRVAPEFTAPLINSTVNSAVTQLDGRVLIGGAFTTVDGIQRLRIARLKSDGALDPEFNPGVTGTVSSMVALPDGSIFAGGSFTTFGGQPAAALGRLNPDGSSSTPVSLYSDGPIHTLMALPDGKVFAAGERFTTYDSVFTAFRVNGDGTLDTGFEPLESSFADGALCLAFQPDGKIIVGGGGIFGMLRRFHADGTPDSSFLSGYGGTAFAVALQADGKIVVGGQFTSLNGPVGNYIARFHSNGSLDESFNPSANNIVRALAIQADGRILLGGDFSNIAGVTRVGLARLNPDGSIDSAFNPNSTVRSINLEKDGKITVAGGFAFISGRYRSRIARLLNDPAVSELSVTGGSQIDWLRGGSAPEVIQAEFTTWDGNGWSQGVPAARVAGGWRATGLTLPAGRWIRARGFGASNHGASGLIEEILGEGIIGTLPVTNISSTSATLHGEIIGDGGAEVISRGVVYGPSQDLTLTDGTVLVGAGESATFSVEATGLDEETGYFARAYVTTALGTSYGEAVEFMTAKQVVFEDNLADLTRTINPGRSRLFRFTIDMARAASLTIEDAAGLRAILRRHDGTVLVTAEGSPDIVIDEVLVPGEYVLEIEHLAQTEDPLGFQLAIDASVEAMTRPDLAVGANTANWIGLGVYPPSRQFLPIASKKAKPVLANIRIVNDGQLPDIMALQGGLGNSLFTVSYFGAGGNITAEVATGLFRTSELSEGDGEEQIRLAITPNKKKLIYKRGKKILVRKAKIAIPVSVLSTYDSQISDGGLIEVNHR